MVKPVSVSKGKAKVKKKIKELVLNGMVYVHCSFNNTIVTITDSHGNRIAQESAGSVGFTGAKKSTPYAAQTAVRKAAQGAKEYGLKNVEVFVRGAGPGKIDAVRALETFFKVLMVQDVTGIPHNGCRPEKERRV